MVERIRRFVKEYGLIQPKDKVLAGISGGPDSVCLLFVLRQLQEELDFGLMAVHVNHGLRGEDADEDQCFVEKLCKEQKIPLTCVSLDVQEKAAGEKLTLEEAGRICRYKTFRHLAAEYGCKRIAVGHHGDDQAETMLFHLFRGTGLKGLAGMKPIRGDIIRPLLCVERREILSWLQQQGIAWRTDDTNQDTVYSRNLIRHRILACAKEQINSETIAHMCKASEELREIEAFLEEETKHALQLCVKKEEGGCFITAGVFRRLHPVLAGRVLRTCMEEAGGSLKDIDRRHIRLLGELFGKRTGSVLNLPGGRRAVRRYTGVQLWRRTEDKEPPAEPAIRPGIPGSCRVKGRKWVFSLESAEKYQIIPEKTYTKWFDYDKIENYPEIRRRLPGDYLEINQACGRKKLKKYFIDEKVPAEERGEILLLADGNHIIWIPGMRISERYKVTEHTKDILKVQIYGGEEDGRKNPNHDSGGRG